ncbi:hypothetical protein RB628_40080, partial [Streptomyces sp. ADMS]|uniref:hypothetical protein n=1 Tax=Streptomyces sp. ADMS TaxID=3071415 RepID=UPI00296E4B75
AAGRGVRSSGPEELRSRVRAGQDVRFQRPGFLRGSGVVRAVGEHDRVDSRIEDARVDQKPPLSDDVLRSRDRTCSGMFAISVSIRVAGVSAQALRG